MMGVPETDRRALLDRVDRTTDGTGDPPAAARTGKESARASPACTP